MRPIRLGERRHKYGAQRTRSGEISFASKLEAKRYEQLVALQHAGAIAWFIRQPSFDLGGGVRYIADFLVVTSVADFGRLVHVQVEDCKGVETEAFKIKRRLMADRYPRVNLRILTRKEIGR